MSNLINGLIDQMSASGELVHGAAARIRAQPFFGGRTEDAVERIFRFLHEGTPESELRKSPFYREGDKAPPTLGQRCVSPTFKADRSKSPLETMLGRFPLRDGAAARLASLWQLDIGHYDPPAMAREVVRRLELRENHQHWRTPPPRPRYEEEVLELLRSTFYVELSGDQREALAQKIAAEQRKTSAPRNPGQIVADLAKVMANPALAELSGYGSIAPDDPRLRAAADERLNRSKESTPASPSNLVSAF